MLFQRPKTLADRFLITPMEKADLGRVSAIEKDSFSMPWAKKIFAGAIAAPLAHAWVILDRRLKGRGVVGYACVWEEGERFRLNNLCVAASYRGQGLGRMLLEFIVDQAVKKAKTEIRLEVRHLNRAALALYRAAGFQQVGIKAKYYPDTGEDAVLMCLEVGETAPPQ